MGNRFLYSFFSLVFVSNTIVLTEENKDAMNSVISNAQPHMPFEVDPQRKVLKYISAILNGLFFDMVTDSCYCCCLFLESVAPNSRKKKTHYLRTMLFLFKSAGVLIPLIACAVLSCTLMLK